MYLLPYSAIEYFSSGFCSKIQSSIDLYNPVCVENVVIFRLFHLARVGGFMHVSCLYAKIR